MPVALAAVIVASSWIVLGLVALLRARPEDIPTIVRALAMGAPTQAHRPYADRSPLSDQLPVTVPDGREAPVPQPEAAAGS
ncbi:hypothetical protein GCM10027176_23790 [Actinoallomurus bryophytorum]